jgi:serine/threonine protein kinase
MTFLITILQNNVLITRSGCAVLTDFGLSQVIDDLIGPSGNTTSTIQGSVRWQAPELVLDDDNQKLQLTFSSDVWSFGCTAYEVHGQYIYLTIKSSI